MRRSILIRFGLLSMLVMLAYNNCAPVKHSFNSDEAVAIASTDDPTPNPEDPNNTVQEFTAIVKATSNGQKPVDLTWVIDNSGSMSEEAAHVRTNLGQFINSVASRSDLKMAVISASGSTGQAVSLPANAGPNIIQVNQTVGSLNSLAIAAINFCPNTDTVGCAAAKNSSNSIVKKMPAGFYRNNSKKVFVIVSDDNSTMSASNFQKAFEESFPGETATVFGFVGLGASLSPCQAKTGAQYQSLTASTGGAVFNICEADWSSKFNFLADSIVYLSYNAVTLPQQNITILEVYLDGKRLNSSEYTAANGNIVIDQTLLQGLQQAEVRVRYQLK